MKQVISAFLFSVVMVGVSYGQPITANVIGAKVGQKGLMGAEYRSGYEWDEKVDSVDGRFTDRIDLFGNVMDGVQARAFLNRVSPSEGDSELTSLFIEPAFQLTEQSASGFDSVLLTGVAVSLQDERAHFARIIYSLQYAPGQWRLRHNSIVSKQFGDDASDAYTYQTRFRFTHEIVENVFAGGEFFGQVAEISDPQALSDEFMRGGLVVEGKITDTVGFQTGLLRGLSDVAPDWAGKLWLNIAMAP